MDTRTLVLAVLFGHFVIFTTFFKILPLKQSKPQTLKNIKLRFLRAFENIARYLYKRHNFLSLSSSCNRTFFRPVSNFPDFSFCGILMGILEEFYLQCLLLLYTALCKINYKYINSDSSLKKFYLTKLTMSGVFTAWRKILQYCISAIFSQSFINKQLPFIEHLLCYRHKPIYFFNTL